MAATAACLGKPARPFTARASPAQRRPRRAAALASRAEVRTAERGLTSGVAIDGMRPTSPKAWEMISKSLKKAGVAFVTPDAAARARTPVVDIRPDNEYKKGRLPGATNCQYYRSIEGWSPDKIIRRLGFSFFGVYGTEANPDFLAQVAAAQPKKNGGVILVCNVGGSLTPTGPSEFGRQSRSLTAAYELVQAGYSNIKVLENGYYGWCKADKEIEMDA
ncbi:rhodanese-like domain-containing chloroplastic [Micractinium conductrix]|uniref:Rhodanese-like domain-containing chloroplastic n=1 Tax=Micractinium conductrix TaxID=554055 RepID=A0A2P6UZV3_9CHLO|nr:rhodanese-like domain-containing chloroplastic [Micractinium conductrix]|eukprot:PSC67375.1 rhodanese-like domain-containing chloroplastic [Micractinium conductrix]